MLNRIDNVNSFADESTKDEKMLMPLMVMMFGSDDILYSQLLMHPINSCC